MTMKHVEAFDSAMSTAASRLAVSKPKAAGSPLAQSGSGEGVASGTPPAPPLASPPAPAPVVAWDDVADPVVAVEVVGGSASPGQPPMTTHKAPSASMEGSERISSMARRHSYERA